MEVNDTGGESLSHRGLIWTSLAAGVIGLGVIYFAVRSRSSSSPFKVGNAKYTAAELRKYDGSDPQKPILVAIEGHVFDVSKNRDSYKPGSSYNVFAGRDASRAYAKISLKEEDAVADTTGLTPGERHTLKGWFDLFKKKYPCVGTCKAD